MTAMLRSMFNRCVSIGLAFLLPLAAYAVTTPPIPVISVTDQILSSYDASSMHVASEYAPPSGTAGR